MSKRIMLVAVVILSSLVTSAALGSTLFIRAQGSFSTMFSTLKYDPTTACSKPYRPYSKDEYARERYMSDAKRYVQCLEDAANNDAEYAQKVVSQGYKTATDDFIRDLRSGY